MRHEPTATELTYLDDLEPDERLHYFITRTMESEEVWRLCNADDWVTREVDGTAMIPLWPYAGLATACAEAGESADAVSLEYFVYHELAELAAEGVQVEVFPGKREGVRMDAAMLFRIFDGKMDEEQYFIEG